MKTLVSVLKKTGGLRGWQTSTLRKRSKEAFWIASELETVRCNAVDSYALRIQTPVDDALMGESTTRFQGKPASIAQLVNDTVARARLVRNPCFGFSPPWSPRESTGVFDRAVSEATLDDLIALGTEIQSFHSRELSRFPLNSLEIFLEDFVYSIENHHGLSASARSTRVVCDYVLTSPDNRHEIMGIKRRRFMHDLALKEQLAEDAAVLSDLQVAQLPPTGELPVVLAGDALDSLFDFFVAQLDGHALFNRYSIFAAGDAVLQHEREPLNIASTPELAGGMHSYSFDELGFPTSRVQLIENSRVKNFLIDGRYADLLGLPRTSALMNIEVDCGETRYEDFLQDGVLELTKFSTFQPNTISGAFSGEIRLGYLHKGGKKIPIKGGSVSGSTQVAFARALKSAERVRRGAYSGPKGVFFEGLTVAGA
ncbi:MAG: metallopeptidase TldD-related protein [Spirochaetota bacterium]